MTTVAACAASVALTESWPLTAGIAAGGFLIDLDHLFDYVVFERQRDFRPAAFLRYYLECRIRRAVLVLHSYELFALLGALAGWSDALPLWGYLLGGLMHLALDLSFNGRVMPRSIGAFYSFTHRLAHGFEATALIGPVELTAPSRFWTAFFAGARLGALRPRRRVPRLRPLASE